MPQLVTAGTTMICSMGAVPAALLVPVPDVLATTPAATAADSIPGTNIPTFGMCMSLGNPEVAAATTAAQGVLTPQPCIPATGAPWTPASVSASVGGIPCVLATSTCQCAFGGTITVVTPAQTFASAV
jgi:hypothetical protein